MMGTAGAQPQRAGTYEVIAPDCCPPPPVEHGPDDLPPQLIHFCPTCGSEWYVLISGRWFCNVRNGLTMRRVEPWVEGSR